MRHNHTETPPQHEEHGKDPLNRCFEAVKKEKRKKTGISKSRPKAGLSGKDPHTIRLYTVHPSASPSPDKARHVLESRRRTSAKAHTSAFALSKLKTSYPPSHLSPPPRRLSGDSTWGSSWGTVLAMVMVRWWKHPPRPPSRTVAAACVTVRFPAGGRRSHTNVPPVTRGRRFPYHDTIVADKSTAANPVTAATHPPPPTRNARSVSPSSEGVGVGLPTPLSPEVGDAVVSMPAAVGDIVVVSIGGMPRSPVALGEGAMVLSTVMSSVGAAVPPRGVPLDVGASVPSAGDMVVVGSEVALPGPPPGVRVGAEVKVVPPRDGDGVPDVPQNMSTSTVPRLSSPWLSSSLSTPEAHRRKTVSSGMGKRVCFAGESGLRSRVKVRVVVPESWDTDSPEISWSAVSNGVTPSKL